MISKEILLFTINRVILTRYNNNNNISQGISLPLNIQFVLFQFNNVIQNFLLGSWKKFTRLQKLFALTPFTKMSHISRHAYRRYKRELITIDRKRITPKCSAYISQLIFSCSIFLISRKLTTVS